MFVIIFVLLATATLCVVMIVGTAYQDHEACQEDRSMRDSEEIIDDAA